MDADRVLMHIRANHHGSCLDRLLPFVQLRRMDLLRYDEAFVLYRAIRGRVLKVTNARFRISQYQNLQSFFGAKPKDYDDINNLMDERALMFYEMCRCFPGITNNWEMEKSAGWLCTHHEKVFFNYEAVLQCRRLGISLHGAGKREGKPDKPENLETWAQSTFIKEWVNLFHYMRAYPDDGFAYTHVREWYRNRFGHNPSHFVETKQVWWFEYITETIRQSGGLNAVKIHGFQEANRKRYETEGRIY
jgi:hypothetical protein